MKKQEEKLKIYIVHPFTQNDEKVEYVDIYEHNLTREELFSSDKTAIKNEIYTKLDVIMNSANGELCVFLLKNKFNQRKAYLEKSLEEYLGKYGFDLKNPLDRNIDALKQWFTQEQNCSSPESFGEVYNYNIDMSKLKLSEIVQSCKGKINQYNLSRFIVKSINKRYSNKDYAPEISKSDIHLAFQDERNFEFSDLMSAIEKHGHKPNQHEINIIKSKFTDRFYEYVRSPDISNFRNRMDRDKEQMMYRETLNLIVSETKKSEILMHLIRLKNDAKKMRSYYDLDDIISGYKLHKHNKTLFRSRNEMRDHYFKVSCLEHQENFKKLKMGDALENIIKDVFLEYKKVLPKKVFTELYLQELELAQKEEYISRHLASEYRLCFAELLTK